MKYINQEDINIPFKANILLSIIIPCYNNSNFTKAALNDLLRLPSNCEIIIVDNASTDDTEEMVNKFFSEKRDGARLIYVQCPKNLLHSGGCNKGYKHSFGKHVIFLNNDIRIKSNYFTWIDSIIESCEKGYLVGLNGGLLTNDFDFIKETDRVYDDKMFYLSGWCLAGSRETFDKLILDHYVDDVTREIKDGKSWGPWEERLFYFNDFDLTIRAKKLSIPLQIQTAPVVHFGKATTKKMNIQKLYLDSKKVCKEIWENKI